MKEKADKSNINEETRGLRKELKRIKESRTLIKTKNTKKGQVIKTHQDRESELIESRDNWKIKCKEQEKECTELDKKYKRVAALFEMKEEQLMEILKEFEELKKKYPQERYQ